MIQNRPIRREIQKKIVAAENGGGGGPAAVFYERYQNLGQWLTLIKKILPNYL